MTQLIGLDLDGVIADFFTVAKQRIKAVADPRHLEQYDLVYNTFPDIHALVGAEAAQPNIYLELEPVPDALGAMEALRELKDLDCCYITSRPPLVAVRENTVTWLKRYGLDNYPLFFTNDKAGRCAELGVSIMVEDTPAQATKIVEGSPTNVILLRQAYNRMFVPSSPRIKMVSCWMDVLFNILFWKGV